MKKRTVLCEKTVSNSPKGQYPPNGKKILSPSVFGFPKAPDVVFAKKIGNLNR